MQLFFESIKIYNGKIFNLHLHIARMNRALQLYYPNQTLFTTLPIHVPVAYQQGLVKCKVTYGATIESIHFENYIPSPCNTYTFGHDDNITYSHKYVDRTELNMHQHINSNVDEIIIVKHNMLTDATYSNICLYDGNHWHTPKFPLLKGTMRQLLVNQHKIIETVILATDMHLYSKICFINAMNDLGAREVNV